MTTTPNKNQISIIPDQVAPSRFAKASNATCSPLWCSTLLVPEDLRTDPIFSKRRTDPLVKKRQLVRREFFNLSIRHLPHLSFFSLLSIFPRLSSKWSILVDLQGVEKSFWILNRPCTLPLSRESTSATRLLTSNVDTSNVFQSPFRTPRSRRKNSSLRSTTTPRMLSYCPPRLKA